jgi:hypothetical protein
MRSLILFVAALALGVLWGKVQAQSVYKCNASSYSEKPCSTRILRSYPSADAARERRAGEVVAHRLPGETTAALELRKRRVHLSDADRDECARLDKKIPFEHKRIENSTQPDEVDDAQDSLVQAKKRFSQLHC